MYRPKEIIFAPTARCNLFCRHCRVDRSKGELDTASALAFLDDCAEHGIERVGFSGGEPFLRVDFLAAISEAVVARGLLFDRLMTNGDWWRDRGDLESGLGAVGEAGFDGILGLSVDDWHGQDPKRLSDFLEAAFSAFGRKDCAEIVTVSDESGRFAFARLEALAEGLGGRLELEEGIPRAIRARARPSEEELASGSSLAIRIVTLPWSRPAEAGAWQAETWFEDDRCEGPGQVLYVHPDGSVAVCCGFANERPELILGQVEEGFAALVTAAETKPLVHACYSQGLSALRMDLEREGIAFPGKTGDQCFFCDWICAQGFGPDGKS